jgi:23S rRNA pseudouridine1911/1915/1917 synthase
MDDDLPDWVTFTVGEGSLPERADRLLTEHFPAYSRSQWQKALKAGQVSLDGKVLTKSAVIGPGQTVQVVLPEPEATSLTPCPMPIEVLFEDEHLIVINKVPGIVVHPGSGTGHDTLCHGLLHYTQGQLSFAAGGLRPGVVHRLDKETSGAILFAKTDRVYHAMVKQFAARVVKKEYLAVICGVPELLSGTIDFPIERHPTVRVKMQVGHQGRPAHTDWAIEEKLGRNYALVRCWLHTGRTHQIRVHLSAIGHPLVGDRTYGFNPQQHSLVQAERVMLHAHRLAFDHPVTGESLAVEAPLPVDMHQCIERLK